jgi:hypothetical protein
MIGVLLTFAMLSSTAASCPFEWAHYVPGNASGVTVVFDLTDRET